MTFRARDPETGEEIVETMTVSGYSIDEDGVAPAWPVLVGDVLERQVGFDRLDDGRWRVYIVDSDGAPTGAEEIVDPDEDLEAVAYRLLGWDDPD